MNTDHHNHHTQSGDEKTEVEIASEPQQVIAGLPVNLKISITEKGKQVLLETIHEMKIHLLIVNEELSWFDHLHPREQPDGTYHISETFPAAGKYLLFTDYKPVGTVPGVKLNRMEATGTIIALPQKPKTKLETTVDGYTVSLVNGNELTTNSVQGLKFSIVKDGRELQEKDMQPYLGATAHIVMISRAGYDFLHIHPVSHNRFPVYAETYIQKTGLYRMWVQFKVNDMIHTADFTVPVVKGWAEDHSTSV